MHMKKAIVSKNIGALALAVVFGLFHSFACGNSSSSSKEDASLADAPGNTQQGRDTVGGPDTSPPVGLDASVDISFDSPADASMDASVDASVDTPVNASIDASVDASVDAPVNASLDASVDSLTCAPNMVACSGICVDPTMDHDNCGGCARACSASEVCYLGQCNQTCPAGTTSCGGDCTDFQSDPHHCGGCSAVDAGSFACGSDQVCSRGQCATSCEVSFVMCLGRCIDPMTNPLYCGASANCTLADGGPSGTACAQGEECSGGVCQRACGIGETRCQDGVCHDLMTEDANCGWCGSGCALDKKCIGGECTCIVPGTCPN